MKKVIGLVLGLLPVSAFAECVPAPDCASIGYTETSCEGDSLKCPFDSTKLKCFPCDSSFRYSCDGENITNPIGNACNNKYAACECDTAAGFYFENGECKCSVNKSECIVGNIYYANGICSNEYKTCYNPIGIIVKDNALIAGINRKNITWGNTGTNVTALEDITVRDTAKVDLDGFSNTAKIVAQFGANADISPTGVAAVYCYNYAPTGLEDTKNKWYMPAAGELYNYIYGNHDILKSFYTAGYDPTNFYSLSSTEYDNTTTWYIHFTSGEVGRTTKSNSNARVYTYCFLDIS